VGHQVRDFIHIDDVVRLTLQLAEMPVVGPVNLGTGIGTSMLGLLAKFARQAGYYPQPLLDDEKPTGAECRVADTTMMRSLGLVPEISLETGVAQALHDREHADMPT